MRPNETESTQAAVYVRVSGRVQGVGYRYFAEEKAQALGLTGWVRNLPDGDVEAEAEGPREALEDWLKQLHRGPSFARVLDMKFDFKPAMKQYISFEIRA